MVSPLWDHLQWVEQQDPTEKLRMHQAYTDAFHSPEPSQIRIKTHSTAGKKKHTRFFLEGQALRAENMGGTCFRKRSGFFSHAASLQDGHQEWLMTSFPLMHLHRQKPRINIDPLHFLHGSVGWMHLGWEFPKPSGEGERSTYRKWIAHQARFTHPDRCAQMVPRWCWRYSLHHLHLSSVRGEDNRWWLWPTKLGKSKINTLPWPYKSCTYLRFLPIITNSPSFSCDADLHFINPQLVLQHQNIGVLSCAAFPTTCVRFIAPHMIKPPVFWKNVA